MKNGNLIYPLLISGALVMLMSSCKKDNPTNPVVKISPVVFNLGKTYGSVTDIDGNTYKTITIGTQTWMAENLRTTKYRNNEVIPNVTDATAWGNASSGAYCNFNNTKNIDTIAIYGRLYNWFAVGDSRNIAPVGWHVPTDAEWTMLTDYLGGWSDAGGKLKETGITHWRTPNTGATNESGFTAISADSRNSVGFFYNDWDQSITLWSSTKRNLTDAWKIDMSWETTEVWRSSAYFSDGYAVRCVKD
jgi:uncharacterized protein (TIGR02145 family)